MVPVVALRQSEKIQTKYGTSYKPVMEIVDWLPRPICLIDEPPYDHREVFKVPFDDDPPFSPVSSSPDDRDEPPPYDKIPDFMR